MFESDIQVRVFAYIIWSYVHAYIRKYYYLISKYKSV